MIHRTIEEVRIIIYLIGYGIFIISMYDTLFLITKKINKVLKTMINLIYIIGTIYFTYEFSYILAKGYIPIHFILFMISGFLIYWLIREKYIEGLKMIYSFLKKIASPIIKILIFLCYPKEFISIILLIGRTIKLTFRDFMIVLKIKMKKGNNKLSK